MLRVRKVKRPAIKPKSRQRLIATEVLMVTLVAMSLALLVIDYTHTLDAAQLEAMRLIDVIIGAIFLVEFIVRGHLSGNWNKYLHRYWWLLLACIPLPTQLAVALRAVRLQGLARIFRLTDHTTYEIVKS